MTKITVDETVCKLNGLDISKNLLHFSYRGSSPKNTIFKPSTQLELSFKNPKIGKKLYAVYSLNDDINTGYSNISRIVHISEEFPNLLRLNLQELKNVVITRIKCVSERLDIDSGLYHGSYVFSYMNINKKDFMVMEVSSDIPDEIVCMAKYYNLFYSLNGRISDLFYKNGEYFLISGNNFLNVTTFIENVITSFINKPECEEDFYGEGSELNNLTATQRAIIKHSLKEIFSKNGITMDVRILTEYSDF